MNVNYNFLASALLVNGARASGLFSFFTGGAANNNATANATATNLMRPLGLGSVVALAANSQYGIYAVQSNDQNKLCYMNDSSAPCNPNVVNFAKPGKILQLQDTKVALFALLDDANIYMCTHPCLNNNWQPMQYPNPAKNGKPQMLMQLGNLLAVRSELNILLIQKAANDVNLQESNNSNGVKFVHSLPDTPYTAYIDSNNRLILGINKDGSFKQNFLGENYDYAMLTGKFLYAARDKMISRCQLPCEQQQMVDLLEGQTRNSTLLANFKNDLLACNKGAPLVAIAEVPQQ